MLVRLIRRFRALRERLLILGAAVLLWLTTHLPLKELPNLYDLDPRFDISDSPGTRADGAGWIAFLTFTLAVLELLRVLLNRPRKLTRWHDRIVIVHGALVAAFGVQVCSQAFNNYLSPPNWGVIFMIPATLAVTAAVVFNLRHRISEGGTSWREWVITELRDAGEELRRPPAVPGTPPGTPPPPPPPPASQ